MTPQPGKSYETMVREARFDLPDRYNIATEICDQWAVRDPGRVCLEYFELSGDHRRLTCGALAELSNALANALSRAGVARGARVALLLPQSFETAIAHVAIYKLAAIAVPLALLFGPEALEYRLRASGAQAIVTNAMGWQKLRGIRGRLPDLRMAICTEAPPDGDPDAGCLSFDSLVSDHSPEFETEETRPDTPAMMIFTSGTTGPPKGALHGHRVLAGHLPGIRLAHDFLPQPGDRMWTPADWAWAGGLLNAVLPALALGVPVVCSRAQKFDAATAFEIMQAMAVRNAFIPPTALRMLAAGPARAADYDLRLRTISAAGEPLGREAFDWTKKTLGVAVNELYGQTECNAVISSCGALGVMRPGSIGKAVPGHAVAVLDDAGHSAAVGAIGEIAVRHPDPVMFLGYWGDEDATEKKFSGAWMLTGDRARQDAEGYITFVGRDDDLITSSGFRIGPSEIEDCLTGHPAVAFAAVVGKPDAVRTEIVKAYVVPGQGIEPDEGLAEDIRIWVKTRLSAHEYPREVTFVDALPLTETGKVVRRLLRERAGEEAIGEGGRRPPGGEGARRPLRNG